MLSRMPPKNTLESSRAASSLLWKRLRTFVYAFEPSPRKCEGEGSNERFSAQYARSNLQSIYHTSSPHKKKLHLFPGELLLFPHLSRGEQSSPNRQKTSKSTESYEKPRTWMLQLHCCVALVIIIPTEKVSLLRYMYHWNGYLQRPEKPPFEITLRTCNCITNWSSSQNGSLGSAYNVVWVQKMVVFCNSYTFSQNSRVFLHTCFRQVEIGKCPGILSSMTPFDRG